jgi:uncharacterized protein YecT (DUF1311 family)
MRAVVALAVLLSLSCAVADPHASEGSEVQAASRDADAAEKRLNQAYARLMKKLGSPPTGLEEHHRRAQTSVVQAQRAWLAFREQDCIAVFDLADGSSKAPLSVSCWATRTDQRAQELNAMADGL